jgi:CubicO group peptidase (beta-lactamase class C family)
MDTSLQIQPEDVGLSSARLARIDPWMRSWVDSGRLPFLSVLVARHGQIVWQSCVGMADVERRVPITPETIVRIYSMTKPLTTVAAMMLYEEGRFHLDDPISRFIPAFAHARVASGGAMWGKLNSVPAPRDITFRDLMSHTSGLTYWFMESSPVDAAYRAAGINLNNSEQTLEEVVNKAAAIPLLAAPGTEWNYSISTDVLGHLVAVISGQPFDDFLRERVIGPLGMIDTDFFVPPSKVERFAACYIRGEDGGLKMSEDPKESPFLRPPTAPSGGGGLLGTAGDYMRFCRFMLNKGELGDVRLLGRKTVELMTSNHLGGDMASMGQPNFNESSFEGVGFGLGFSVMLDPARAQILGTPGEFAWGGAASTAFWCDPAEDMAVVMLSQLVPSSTYPIRRELRVLTYAAIEQ